ncbi:MAG: hypothetical protein JXA49_00020 [Actinobacteria bacterium]|nr:hypothetical protein [Actinomycetota bacterium]
MSAIANLLGQVVTYEISSGGMPGWLLALYFIFGIASYVFMAWCLMVMAQKTNQEYPWFAWIPILNFILMIQIADKEIWWIILFLIPCVNFVAMIIIWMAIAENLGYESWWGILTIVPILNYYVWWKLAFEK